MHLKVEFVLLVTELPKYDSRFPTHMETMSWKYQQVIWSIYLLVTFSSFDFKIFSFFMI